MTKRGSRFATLKSVSVALSVLIAAAASEASENDAGRSERVTSKARAGGPSGGIGDRLTVDSRLRDLLAHPAFADFGQLLLPWDDRSYDLNMPLRDLASLLPYHSHVDPATAVKALNRMADDAAQGKTVFYDFYSTKQKHEQPAKSNTGLFFFRGKPGAPFAVIAPGGGFSYVGSVHEGFPYAEEISRNGYNAFVLRYRAGFGGTVATEDLAAAIGYIFRNAEALGVSTRDYSLWGSSAGARMAAAIGSHGPAAFGGDELPKPATVVMAYTGHSDFSQDEPPTYAVVGENDGIAPPALMERRIDALRMAGTKVEYRKFKDVGHGFGVGTGTSAEGWVSDAIRFWRRSGGSCMGLKIDRKFSCSVDSKND